MPSLNDLVTYRRRNAGAPSAEEPADQDPSAESPAEDPSSLEPSTVRPPTSPKPSADDSDTDVEEDPAPAVPVVPAKKTAKPRAKTGAKPGVRTGSTTRAAIWRLPVVLGVLTVLLGGLAVWFHSEADHLRGASGTHNVALTDTARTSEVKGKIDEAVNVIFSYDYADMAKTERAAKGLLTGKAVQQYDTMLAAVRAQAPKQKLILTTTVTDSGVEMLEGDRARLVIFADQRSTRTVTKDTTYAAAMLAVDAVRQGGTWKISNIDTLTVPR